MLEQREGTPCVPLVFRHKCAPGISCGGIGDRLKGLQVAFWLVRGRDQTQVTERTIAFVLQGNPRHDLATPACSGTCGLQLPLHLAAWASAGLCRMPKRNANAMPKQAAPLSSLHLPVVVPNHRDPSHVRSWVQAVLTDSAFVLDWTRPVPLEEFFVPLDDALSFHEYRCGPSKPGCDPCRQHFVFPVIPAIPHCVWLALHPAL